MEKLSILKKEQNYGEIKQRSLAYMQAKGIPVLLGLQVIISPSKLKLRR